MNTSRYARQVVLPQVGAAGQQRLAQASVLVVGAGGLGCAVLQYLVAAGVGRVLIVDHDRVDASNLHRQPLYRMNDVGQPKAEAARAALCALNPELRIEAVPERLTPANAARWIEPVNIVVDAADSFAVTYTLSDACLEAHKPLVSASVLGLTGYAGVFCEAAPSYRAVFPELPSRAGSCAETGVLGTAVGVLGTLQAHLTLATLLQLSPSVAAQLVTADLQRLRFSGFDFSNAVEPDARGVQFTDLSLLRADDRLIDLRSMAEAPAPVPAAWRSSVEELERVGLPADLRCAPDGRIVLCCRSGLRAWRAARVLQRQGHAHLALVALGT